MQQNHYDFTSPAGGNNAPPGGATNSSGQMTPQPPPVFYPQSKPGRGGSSNWAIVAIVAGVLFLGAISFGVWAFINYADYKENFDSKVALERAEIKKEADAEIAETIAELEKQPLREFAGPEDYGRVSFEYPRTWSVAVYKDASRGGTYEAYLHPVQVPPVTNATQLGLRVTIEEKDFDRVVAAYQSQITRNELSSTSIRLDSGTGVRLDGQFSKDIRGSAVIFKIRDKTLTIRTDAQVFKGDFDKLVQTIQFNQ